MEKSGGSGGAEPPGIVMRDVYEGLKESVQSGKMNSLGLSVGK